MTKKKRPRDRGSLVGDKSQAQPSVSESRSSASLCSYCFLLMAQIASTKTPCLITGPRSLCHTPNHQDSHKRSDIRLSCTQACLFFQPCLQSSKVFLDNAQVPYLITATNLDITNVAYYSELATSLLSIHSTGFSVKFRWDYYQPMYIVTLYTAALSLAQIQMFTSCQFELFRRFPPVKNSYMLEDYHESRRFMTTLSHLSACNLHLITVVFDFMIGA